MDNKEDRRSYPRVQDNRISLKLHLDEFDSMTHAMNISASGIYCKIDKELPLMSRVQLILMIPTLTAAGDEDTKSLKVNGVVVREHPVIINGEVKHYDAAIFFEDCPEKGIELIAQYVNRRMSAKAS